MYHFKKLLKSELTLMNLLKAACNPSSPKYEDTIPSTLAASGLASAPAVVAAAPPLARKAAARLAFATRVFLPMMVLPI